MDFKKIQQRFLDEISEEIHSYNHIQSFNHFLEKGINEIIKDFQPIQYLNEDLKTPLIDSVLVTFADLKIGAPNQIPFQARMTGSGYAADLFATLKITINQKETHFRSFSLGSIPLMTLSKKCILFENKNDLCRFKEDEKEVGGFFIVNGLEKILRNIIIPKKNFPISVIRQTFTQRQNTFTKYAVMIKSSRQSYRAQTLYLHYTTDQQIFMSIMIRKVEYLFPLGLIIKGMKQISDLELVKKFEVFNSNFNPLKLLEQTSGKNTREECLQYLGFLTRPLMRVLDQGFYQDREVGRLFLEKYVLIHLDDNLQKIQLLAFMTQKLVLLAEEKLKPDNLDSLSTQEILSSGQLYGMFFRERLEELIEFGKSKFQKDCQKLDESRPEELIPKIIEGFPKIGQKIETLISTGNLKSHSGLDLMQNNGLSILAERLNNMRFWAHLRSIHRGAYFVEMKTTTVRKLLPDSWGFMCPVHTPDGSLCGLLNHMSLGCVLQHHSPITQREKQVLIRELCSLGMIIEEELGRSHLSILLDGEVLGWVQQNQAEEIAKNLRLMKNPDGQFPFLKTLSITLCLPQEGKQSQFPGIFLSLSEGRTIRKVFNIQGRFTETIDPYEQSYMMIATNINEMTESHTHVEILEDAILSDLAAQTPFMVHNQSPRNMYQCQMAKQTMGTSTHNILLRNDNKTYSITYVQEPIVSNQTMDKLGFKKYPSGLNAIVAVLSYTGYDVEDAMIINRSAYQRGLMHGKVYKTFQLDLPPQSGRDKAEAKSLVHQMDSYSTKYESIFKKRQEKRIDINELIAQEKKSNLDIDGMPKIGSKLQQGNEKLSYYDYSQEKQKFQFHKDKEQASVEMIYFASHKDKEEHTQMTMRLCVDRNPVVGDKFSSRHGQKGVLSVLWPQQDMPFSENGITPDIIINPNAFPSRMTIGMLIECLAGKTWSLQGKKQSSPAFDRCDFYKIGDQLKSFGFNKMGNETLYSGIYGVPLQAEIFQGVVYYQRLRHMIKDKAQARNKGPIDCLTRQPIKGRKKGGGIRLGEMERDALIAHGVSYILKERLLNSSDISTGFICDTCNSLISTFSQEDQISKEEIRVCVSCQNEGKIYSVKRVVIPYVLRYLANELAAMNIRIDFGLK